MGSHRVGHDRNDSAAAAAADVKERRTGGEGSIHSSCCRLLGRQGTPNPASNCWASGQPPPARTAGPERRWPASSQGPSRSHTAVEQEGCLRAEGRVHPRHRQAGARWREMLLASWARTSETGLIPGAQTQRTHPEDGGSPISTRQPLYRLSRRPRTTQDPHQPAASSWDPGSSTWLPSNPARIYGSQR